jgi:F1F0 ATPase subunit 2
MDFAEIGMLGLSFVVGLGVGVIFYMGLWWTILMRFSAKHLMLCWWTSFIVRIIATGSIFYLIANEHFARYAFIMLGFMLSRKIILNIKALRVKE